jgi:transcriptional regulator with XRE-family HTH domain
MAGGTLKTSNPVNVEGVSPLRQARRAIPATLEQVCGDLDQQSKEGSAGVTPSMLSGWERGKHVTSIKYRKLLADYYTQPADALFAHQDQRLTVAAETPRLLVGHHDLRNAMTEVVRGARHYLASWDPGPATRLTWRPSKPCSPSDPSSCTTGCCSDRRDTRSSRIICCGW